MDGVFNGWGVSWTRINVANSDSAEWDPGIVVDKNNRIHLHYHEYKKGNYMFSTMEYKYTDNLGASWSPIQTLSVPGIRSQLSVFSYNHSSNVHCICWKDERDWIYFNDIAPDVMCSFSTDSGNTWVGQELVNDLDTIPTSFKSVEVGSNSALYVTFEYEDPITNRTSIWFTRRTPVLSVNMENMATNFSWNAFPNPAKNKIFIRTDLKNYTLDMYDVSGKVVYHSYEGNTIDITNIPSGVYVLKISSDNFFKVQKIMIQK